MGKNSYSYRVKLGRNRTVLSIIKVFTNFLGFKNYKLDLSEHFIF